MLLIIDKENLDNSKIIIKSKKRDYNLYESRDIDVFSYGYPYNINKKCWLTAKDLFNYYQDNEFNFLDEIDGVYGIIILNKKKKRSYVIIDCYGVYSLFYSKSGDRLFISDNINEITSFFSTLILNRTSIIEYLIFRDGFKIGNKTHIKNIYEFEAASLYQIDEKLNINKKLYWFLENDDNLKIKFNDLIDIFNNHVLTSYNLSNKISFPLTGGLDTRTILSALYLKQNHIHCCTYGEKNSMDVKIAKKISKRLGLNHDFYELDIKFIMNLQKNLETNFNIFNGLISTLRFLHIKELCEKEQGNGELFIWGILGNEIWRNNLLNLTNINNKLTVDDASKKIIHSMIKIPEIFDVFKNLKRNEILDLLQNSIKDELLLIGNSFNIKKIMDVFAFRNYFSNWASNIIKFTGRYFKIYLGLFNKKLIKALLQIDIKYRISGFVQKEIIKNNNSVLAALPLGSGDLIKKNFFLKLIIKIRKFYKKLISIINYYSYKVIKKKIFNIKRRHNYSDWLRKFHKDFILKILNYDNLLIKDLFRKERYELILKLFLNGDNNLFLFFSSLISLELWIRNIKKDKRLFV